MFTVGKLFDMEISIIIFENRFLSIVDKFNGNFGRQYWLEINYISRYLFQWILIKFLPPSGFLFDRVREKPNIFVTISVQKGKGF